MNEFRATTLRLPETLYHEIRIRAITEKRLIADIVAEALREWLSKHPADGSSKAKVAR